jgi:uncharacterized repeat protein (TIGR02543 family)
LGSVHYLLTVKLSKMKRNFYLAMLCLVLTIGLHPAFAQTNCTLYGWATQNGGTTGGGAATPITVSTLADLQAQANSTGAKVIYVSGTMGSGAGTRVLVAANKTIIGLPGATLYGGFDIRSNNVIIRNMKVRGPGAVDVNGVDCIAIQAASNVWIDHCEIYDGQDGNLDITNDANYVTVSWTKFYYTAASSNHQFCNLIGSSDTRTTDRGKLKVTFLYNWWGPGVRERMPRVRFGQVHVVNNYFNSTGNSHCVRAGVEANLLVEGNYFEGVNTPVDLYENNFTAVTVRNNVFVSTTGNTAGSGTAFTPPYALPGTAAADVKSMVTNSASGAGATMSSPTNCSGTTATYTLNTSSTPSAGGTVSKSPSAASYNAGTVVTLTATPAAGYVFTGWSGDATGTASSIDVTMDANKTITANFEQSATGTYTLTTNVSPSGGGTITRSPNAASYSSGTSVTLTATPASGYTFTGWSGDATGTASSVTITMNANKTVTASFQQSGGTASTILIEDNATAATGLCSFDGSISSNSGASNGKVINLTNSSAKGITWSVVAPSGGSYTLNWRYVNSSSSNAYTMKLIVNGVTINSALGFPKTSSSTTFSNTTATVNLAAGSNTIRLETTVSSATADIDWMEVTGNSPSAGNCTAPVTRIVSPEEAEAEAKSTLSVYPNPAKDRAVFTFYAPVKERVSLAIHRADGSTVETVAFTAAQGRNQRSVSLQRHKPGTYYLVLVHQSGEKETKKLVIQ